MVEWPLATPTIGFVEVAVAEADRAQHGAVGRARVAMGDRLASPVVAHAGELRCGIADYRLGFHSTRTHGTRPCSSTRTSTRSRSISAPWPSAGTASCTWWGSPARSGWGGCASSRESRPRDATRPSTICCSSACSAWSSAAGSATCSSTSPATISPICSRFRPCGTAGCRFTADSWACCSRSGGWREERTAMARSHRFPRAAQPACVRRREARQLHQRRAAGARHHRALGHDFPGAGPLPRHPSQLYQFALEGVLLFVILWIYSAKPRPAGSGVRRVPDRLRRAPFRGRVLQGAR